MPESPVEAINYQGLGKHERRGAAAKDPRLERRRFLYPSSPELRERLRKIRDIFNDIRIKYPEAVALSFFGSHTKSYALDGSDLDGFLFVDTSRLTGNEREEYSHTQKQYSLEMRATEELRSRLKQEVGLTEDQVFEIHPYLINAEKIEEKCAHSYNFESLFAIFMLSTEGIRPYREKVFDTLEKDPNGKGKWVELADKLWDMENRGFPDELIKQRKALYPWTLEAARAYFLPQKKTQEETLDSIE